MSDLAASLQAEQELELELTLEVDQILEAAQSMANMRLAPPVHVELRKSFWQDMLEHKIEMFKIDNGVK